MTRSFRAALLSGVALLAIAGTATAQNSSDPPARVGRLSYLEGAVSYHDAQQDSWSKAAVNTPVTSGDSLWTEPNGHDEVSIGASRVRMDGNTQLDMLALDDSQVKMQLDQGRLDIKAFDMASGQPYQIVTPRGTVTLQDKGDYYIHAGSTDDPTLLGVRSGAAQIQTPNGQVLAVRAGEVGEVTGDNNALQLQTVHSAPPAQPTYWAQRDQQITYVQPQYLSDDVTGYEDMAYYGAWNADPDYGQVWYPNSQPDGWAPYTTGAWAYSQPYGWTWVDSQPWGFAPYHYGRWAQRNNRWAWIPPDRQQRSVYAPALVAFVGGTELGVAIGAQNRSPVGWFPLGPHEAYVPPYSNDRSYYQRLNAGARVPDPALNDRWQRAERHEALTANQPNEQLMNRRFTTVVSADDFARSRPVQQAAIKVSADKLTSAPVASVSAPPAPNRSIAPASPQATANRAPAAQAQAPGTPATSQTRFANTEEIARPQAERGNAPGPKIAARTAGPNATTNATANTNAALPALAPRVGTAPPKLEGERTPAVTHPGQTPPVPQANRAEPNRAEPNRAEPQKPNEPARAEPQAQHPATAPAAPPQANRAEPLRPNEPARNEARPAETHAAPAAAPQPQHQEPQRPAETHAAPAAQPQHQEPPHQAEAPRPQQAVPQAPHPAAPPPQAMPQAPHPAAAPPQQAQAPHPAPPPAQAAPAPHPAPPPAAPAKKEEEKK
jgi:hypothetical protein